MIVKDGKFLIQFIGKELFAVGTFVEMCGFCLIGKPVLFVKVALQLKFSILCHVPTILQPGTIV